MQHLIAIYGRYDKNARYRVFFDNCNEPNAAPRYAI